MIGDSLFQIDDVVRVAGFNGKAFKVYSVKYTENFYLGVHYYGYLYKVMDIKTYEILDDVFEEDMQLVEHKIKTSQNKPQLTTN